MAGIDKIVGTRAQYEELLNWLDEAEPFYPWSLTETNYLHGDDKTIHIIANFSTVEDFYLWHNCPIPWVKARLKEQYGPGGPCSKGKKLAIKKG